LFSKAINDKSHHGEPDNAVAVRFAFAANAAAA
jgi:hypothetical protein